MNTNYQKILLTFTLAFVLNATAWAFIIYDNGVTNSKYVVKTENYTPYKSANNLLNADFENFIQRFSSNKRYVSNGFDINSSLLKSIDNVRVFPNPVSTQINITYFLSKDGQVVIKILDVLGNEILTLLNQKVQAGEQSNSFILNSKIPTGFYFVRIFSGNDSVIKRISVI